MLIPKSNKTALLPTRVKSVNGFVNKKMLLKLGRWSCLCTTLTSALLLLNESHANDVSFSTGLAEQTHAGLIDCGSRSRVSAVGEIQSEDGNVWIVPADTHFLKATKATDMYNECGDTQVRSLKDLDLSAVPVFDAGGSEEFTAYIFADNYFELNVNGVLVAVDPVPFTPFNSNVVRFKADRPITLAILGVDWEENLGLGSEKGRGKRFSPGDAGLVAKIVDSEGNTVKLTDASWRAQTFYTSPISDRSCLMIKDGQRDSSSCSTAGSNSAEGLSAAHWPIPENWTATDFDDVAWPLAVTYSNDTVGVNNKSGYTNFTDVFDTVGDDAQFIWSSNLVLDNLVLMRVTIP